MLAWAETVTAATLQGVDVTTGKAIGVALATLKDSSSLAGAAASNGIQVASALLAVPAGSGSVFVSVGIDGSGITITELGGKYPYVMGLVWI